MKKSKKKKTIGDLIWRVVFLAALVMFFIAGFWPGLSWLVVAFLLSPYGLPMAAAWLVGMIGGVNGSLKDFIFG